MNLSDQEIAVCWLRRDLRLDDNTALYHALRSNFPVLVCFVFDTEILSLLPDKKDKRVSYIHHTLHTLDAMLQREGGSSLLCLYGTPADSFKRLCELFHVKKVYANHDYEPYAIERDKEIEALLRERGANFYTFKDQVIFEKSEVLKSNGEPYTVFTPYSRMWKQKLAIHPIKLYPSEALLSKCLKHAPFPVPSLKDMGFEYINPQVPAVRLAAEILASYADDRNTPGIEGTSYAGVYLRFGTLSIRRLVTIATKHSEVWLNELIWREFFMMILYHFPKVVTQNFNSKYNSIQWRNNEQEFERWCRGETGYALVDAGMRQLNATGWMHNRVRMVVASFLTKHLLIDWRWGEAYFGSKLLDYELSSNNGNWQWAASCGCDAAPYYRIFNPALQAKKFDPELRYIKRWIPGYSGACLPPLVDHDFARKRALETYKKALSEVG